MSESDTPRSPEQPLWEDALVEEVRALRRRLWEQAGRDIPEYVARSRQAGQRRAHERKSHGQDAA